MQDAARMGKKFFLSIPFLLLLLPLVAFAKGSCPGIEKGIPVLVEKHVHISLDPMTNAERGKTFESIVDGLGTSKLGAIYEEESDWAFMRVAHSGFFPRSESSGKISNDEGCRRPQRTTHNGC